MGKKTGIELSVNFLVMFILAAAMFITGLYIVFEIFHKLSIFHQDMEERLHEEIVGELTPDNGIGLHREHIEKGSAQGFVLGIENHWAGYDTFYVHTDCDIAVEPDNVILCDDDAGNPCDPYDSWVTESPIGPLTVRQGESITKTIWVFVPQKALSGTYTFRVKVCTDNPCTNQYKTNENMHVVVNS